MGVSNGKRLIERIVALAPTESRKLHVPEWDVDLYFAPLTKAQLEAAKPEADVSAAVESLYLLIHMARDKEGQPVFQERDIDGLREKADLHVLTRIERFMWDTQSPSVAAAKAELKNVEGSSNA